MAYPDYDDPISISNRRTVPSLAASGQQEGSLPVTRRGAALPGCLWQLALRARAWLSRLGKFLLVGGTGVLVNSLALLLLFQWVHLPLVVAAALSAELAIVHNFYWNDRWTFKRTRPSWSRFARFNLVSLAGLCISTGTLWLLAGQLGLYYLAANLLGIGLAMAWNFAANVLWTWGGVR